MTSQRADFEDTEFLPFGLAESGHDLYQQLSQELLPDGFSLLFQDSKVLLLKIELTAARGPVITASLEIRDDFSFSVFRDQSRWNTHI